MLKRSVYLKNLFNRKNHIFIIQSLFLILMGTIIFLTGSFFLKSVSLYIQYQNFDFDRIVVSNNRFKEDSYLYLNDYRNLYISNEYVETDIYMINASYDYKNSPFLEFHDLLNTDFQETAIINYYLADEYNLNLDDKVSYLGHDYHIKGIVFDVEGLDQNYSRQGLIILSNTIDNEANIKYMSFISGSFISNDDTVFWNLSSVKAQLLNISIIYALFLLLIVIVIVSSIEWSLEKYQINDFRQYISLGITLYAINKVIFLNFFVKYFIPSIFVINIFLIVYWPMFRYHTLYLYGLILIVLFITYFINQLYYHFNLRRTLW